MKEPDFNSEAELESALAVAVERACESRGVEVIILNRFGLDLAVFARKNGKVRTCFIETKAPSSNHGRWGFGDGSGGNQLSLLYDRSSNAPRPKAELELLDDNIRWVLGDRSKRSGSTRFLLFSCADAQAAAMNSVFPGKQNNFRPSYFSQRWMAWEDLVINLTIFIDPERDAR